MRKYLHALWIPILMILMLVQLLPTFNTYFMADDFAWLGFVKNIDSLWENLLSLGPGGFTAPICNAYFYMLFKLFGEDPLGYYAANALVHIANAILVYGLVRLVTQDERVAVAGAMIFALHFSQYSDWGAVVWVAVFEQLVVGCFYLASFLLFVAYIRRGSWPFYVGSLICFALALASRQTAISLPLLLLVSGIIMHRTWRGSRWTVGEAAVTLLPFAALEAVYLAYELSLQLSGHYFREGLYSIGPHLITNFKYFSNLVMPNPTSPPVHSFLQRSFPVWVLALSRLAVLGARMGLLVTTIVLFWKGTRISKLWLAMMFVTYLPFIGFVEGFAGPNRYFYLPLVGFSALLSQGLWWMYDHASQWRGKALAASVTAIVVVVVWGYNLVPIRAWERQMQANSRVRREVVQLVEECVSRPDSALVSVEMVGFPAKFGDLAQAIKTLSGVPGWLNTAHQKHNVHDVEGVLVLEYEQDKVEVRAPCPSESSQND